MKKVFDKSLEMCALEILTLQLNNKNILFIQTKVLKLNSFDRKFRSKRFNNGPPFFQAFISYINRVHACKKVGPLFKR